MDFKQYLFEKTIKDENLINELIKIDNSIQLGNISQNYFRRLLLSNNVTYDQITRRINLITDGEITTTILMLYKYGPNINTINVNMKNLGINKWLIKTANEYFNNYYGINIDLDISNNYNRFVNDDLIFVGGFKEFVKGTKKLLLLQNKNLKIVEIITK